MRMIQSIRRMLWLCSLTFCISVSLSPSKGEATPELGFNFLTSGAIEIRLEEPENWKQSTNPSCWYSQPRFFYRRIDAYNQITFEGLKAGAAVQFENTEKYSLYYTGTSREPLSLLLFICTPDGMVPQGLTFAISGTASEPAFLPFSARNFQLNGVAASALTVRKKSQTHQLYVTLQFLSQPISGQTEIDERIFEPVQPPRATPVPQIDERVFEPVQTLQPAQTRQATAAPTPPPTPTKTPAPIKKTIAPVASVIGFNFTTSGKIEISLLQPPSWQPRPDGCWQIHPMFHYVRTDENGDVLFDAFQQGMAGKLAFDAYSLLYDKQAAKDPLMLFLVVCSSSSVPPQSLTFEVVMQSPNNRMGFFPFDAKDFMVDGQPPFSIKLREFKNQLHVILDSSRTPAANSSQYMEEPAAAAPQGGWTGDVEKMATAEVYAMAQQNGFCIRFAGRQLQTLRKTSAQLERELCSAPSLWKVSAAPQSPNGLLDPDYLRLVIAHAQDAQPAKTLHAYRYPEDAVSFQTAQEIVAQLNAVSFGGFADWRLPTLAELCYMFQSQSPLFSQAGQTFWSMTKNPTDSGLYWGTDATLAVNSYKTKRLAVLAVRSE